MGAVTLPREYFEKTAKHDYRRPKEAFLREFLQNSRDAKATQIDLTIRQEGEKVVFECRDNGTGMNKTIVTDVLMALGASSKSDDPTVTGGFGVAKILIFFAHESYQIRTQNLLVTGAGGHYEISETEDFQAGCFIQVVLSKEVMEYEAEVLTPMFKRLIQKSWLPKLTITVNGEPVPANLKPGRRTTTLDETIAVHCTKEHCHEVLVRVKGLFMFSFSHYDSKYRVIIELEGYSTKYLTTNRDSFKYEWQDKVTELVQKMNMSGENEESQLLVFKGKESRVSPIAVALQQFKAELGQSAFNREEGVQLARSVAKTLTSQRMQEAFEHEAVAAVDQLLAGRLDVSTFTFPEEKLLLFDYFVHLRSRKIRKIPARFDPAKMKAEYWELLDLWADVIGLVLRDVGSQNLTYGVGFVLDDGSGGEKAMAEYTLRPEGQHIFLLNPMETDSLPLAKQKRLQLVMQLANLASHEVCHFLGKEWHNEWFIKEEVEVRRKMSIHFDDYLKLAINLRPHRRFVNTRQINLF